MTKKYYSSKELNIPYEDAVLLRNSGQLNLGINNSLAIKIVNTKGAGPKNRGVSAAFHFWSWIGILIFGYTIYLSFTSNWWSFIFGLIALKVIWGANKKSNAENILSEAMKDKDFYDRIYKEEGWLYEINENEAKKYFIN